MEDVSALKATSGKITEFEDKVIFKNVCPAGYCSVRKVRNEKNRYARKEIEDLTLDIYYIRCLLNLNFSESSVCLFLYTVT